MCRQAGFTLIEIMLSIVMGVMIVLLAVPSIEGLFTQRDIEAAFERLDHLAREAQRLALEERRAYVLAWVDEEVIVRPEVLRDEEGEDFAADRMPIQNDESWAIEFPAALEKKPASVWTFWPSGTCEPARVRWSGKHGTWTATYEPLTARALLEYGEGTK